MPRNRLSITLVILLWIVVFVGFIALIVREKKPSNQPESAPTPANKTIHLDTATEPPSLFTIPPTAALSPIPPHPEAAAIGNKALSPEQELVAIQAILTSYLETVGALPTAETNSHVLAQLRGANPANRAWFPSEHPRLNSEGALVDRYGTPYFFHFESSRSVSIRSAGMDRELYTDDDLFLGKSPTVKAAY